MDLESEVAIVVPAYMPSEKNTIGKTLRYLRDNVRGVVKGNLYLVWNNNSSENFSSLVAQLGSYAQTLEVKGSKSKAENLNKFISLYRHQYKYILIYDADARPSCTSVQQLYNTMRSIGDTYAFVQGNFQFSRGNQSFTRGYDTLEHTLYNIWVGGTVNRPSILGHDVIISTDALYKVDGFDPDYLLEDAELTSSLYTAGYKGYFLGGHRSSSESAATFYDLVRQRYRWTAGRYQLNPGVIVFKTILAIIWIALYVFFPWQTIIYGFILGLVLFKFNIGVAFLFLWYPLMVLIITGYFVIHGIPKGFCATPRDDQLAGKVDQVALNHSSKFAQRRIL